MDTEVWCIWASHVSGCALKRDRCDKFDGVMKNIFSFLLLMLSLFFCSGTQSWPSKKAHNWSKSNNNCFLLHQQNSSFNKWKSVHFETLDSDYDIHLITFVTPTQLPWKPSSITSLHELSCQTVSGKGDAFGRISWTKNSHIVCPFSKISIQISSEMSILPLLH